MKATECKCVECGKQAVAFWPIIDPDILAHPYCRSCLDKAKAEVVAKALGLPDAVAKKSSKIINPMKLIKKKLIDVEV